MRFGYFGRSCITLFIVLVMCFSAWAGNRSGVPESWKRRNGWKNPEWIPPDGYNDSLSKQGYGVKVHRFKETRNGKPFIRFDYTINMPCFFTAPENTPCDRGYFGRTPPKDKPHLRIINRAVE